MENGMLSLGLGYVGAGVENELEVEDVNPRAGIAPARPVVESRAYATAEIGVAPGEAIEHGRSAWYRV